MNVRAESLGVPLATSLYNFLIAFLGNISSPSTSSLLIEADRTAQLQTALNGKHSAQRPALQICISHGTVPAATRHLET
jgi:hypothetical protein